MTSAFNKVVVARLPPEVILEICSLVCTDVTTGYALRCVSKSIFALIKNFSVAAVGYDEPRQVADARTASNSNHAVLTRHLTLCDCVPSLATRQHSDDAWDIRRFITESLPKTQHTGDLEGRIAELNPNDNADINDKVLLDVLGCFGSTLRTLKVMVLLPHQPEVLLDFLDKADILALETLAIVLQMISLP